MAKKDKFEISVKQDRVDFNPVTITITINDQDTLDSIRKAWSKSEDDCDPVICTLYENDNTDFVEAIYEAIYKEAR